MSAGVNKRQGLPRHGPLHLHTAVLTAGCRAVTILTATVLAITILTITFLTKVCHAITFLNTAFLSMAFLTMAILPLTRTFTATAFPTMAILTVTFLTVSFLTTEPSSPSPSSPLSLPHHAHPPLSLLPHGLPHHENPHNDDPRRGLPHHGEFAKASRLTGAAFFQLNQVLSSYETFLQANVLEFLSLHRLLTQRSWEDSRRKCPVTVGIWLSRAEWLQLQQNQKNSAVSRHLYSLYMVAATWEYFKFFKQSVEE
ncbi:hypothetical protein Q9966_004941 [Columba livia]|nr:hypothetical protein Q9966_004941 [Columba livia]